MKVAIIGGGASGLVASIKAARTNNEVYLFEKNSDVGKKLLITGNGRCNFATPDQNLKHYHSANKELISDIINDYNLAKVTEFFNSIGIIPKEKNGCIYPYSEKANSIKSSLQKEAINLGVKFIFNNSITNIMLKDSGFQINDIYFDKLIIATGSKCAPKTGSDGSGYEIAKKFNHTINPVNPALMQVVSNLGIEKDWSGKRVEAIVSHYEDNNLVKQEKGELQLTNYGLSGICIFNLSRDIRLGLNKGKTEEVHINFIPWCCEDVKTLLTKRSNLLKNRNITELCDGFLDYNISHILAKINHIDPNKSWNELTLEEQDKFSNSLKDFIVPIIDTKSFDEAQTCSGGIPLSEINLTTMESLKHPNILFCGEIIDLDGDCGGYNLTVAWITGLLAGDIHD